MRLDRRVGWCVTIPIKDYQRPYAHSGEIDTFKGARPGVLAGLSKDWIGLVFRAYWLYRVTRDSQAAAVRAPEMEPDRILRP